MKETEYLILNKKIRVKDINATIVASVVPELTEVFLHIAHKNFKAQPLLFSNSIDVGIDLAYQQPEYLGTDRIANLVAMKHKYNRPAIVADFGTATTYDAITNNTHLGGVIAPGIKTTLNLLKKSTAQLPEIELKAPKSIWGHSTIECMQAGITYSAAFAANGIIREMKKDMPNNTVVAATGGLASFIAPFSCEIEIVNDHLTLEGLYHIYKHIKK